MHARADGGVQVLFNDAATIDNPRETGGQDIEQGADACDQEDRRDGQLDDLNYVVG
jgi:hypothetical protein